MDKNDIEKLAQATAAAMGVNAKVANDGSALKLGAANVDNIQLAEEKKELRKKLKSHYKMLSDKADEHYEKGETELGKKYRGMANKLADDMDDESKELSLSDYELSDEAALSNSTIDGMKLLREELDSKFLALSAEIKNTITTQLSGVASAAAKNPVIDELENVLNKVKTVLEGK